MHESRSFPTRDVEQDEGELNSEEDMQSSSSEGFTTDGEGGSDYVSLTINCLPGKMLFISHFNVLYPRMTSMVVVPLLLTKHLGNADFVLHER